MKKKNVVVSGVISLISFAFIAAHLKWPNIGIDSTTLFLLAFAIIPWLGSLFESLELPGGLKVSYNKDLDAATKNVEASGLIEKNLPIGKPDPIYIALVREDPTLALAGLRIDIERRLRRIAERYPDIHVANIRQLLEELSKRNVITQDEAYALSDILISLNSAVHGEPISRIQAESVLDVGWQLIQSLDRKYKLDF